MYKSSIFIYLLINKAKNIDFLLGEPNTTKELSSIYEMKRKQV